MAATVPKDRAEDGGRAEARRQSSIRSQPRAAQRSRDDAGPHRRDTITPKPQPETDGHGKWVSPQDRGRHRRTKRDRTRDSPPALSPMTLDASLFPVEHIYDSVVADDGRQRAFVCLAALLIAFFLIRTSARMTRAFTWWPGGVETEGGIHLRHFVWGI